MAYLKVIYCFHFRWFGGNGRCTLLPAQWATARGPMWSANMASEFTFYYFEWRFEFIKQISKKNIVEIFGPYPSTTVAHHARLPLTAPERIFLATRAKLIWDFVCPRSRKDKALPQCPIRLWEWMDRGIDALSKELKTIIVNYKSFKLFINCIQKGNNISWSENYVESNLIV